MEELRFLVDKKTKKVKNVLTFCERCGNVMVLKGMKKGSTGIYECRTCGLVKDMPIEKIEIREVNLEEEVPSVPQTMIPLRY